MAQYDLGLNTPLLLPRALTCRDHRLFLDVGYFVKTNLQSEEEWLARADYQTVSSCENNSPGPGGGRGGRQIKGERSLSLN